MTVKKENKTDMIKILLKTRTAKIIFKILFCLVVLPPIVHVFVLLFFGVYLLQAGDILVYWGSLVAFGGTVLLALVAWGQNKELVEINKQMQDMMMQENRAKFILSEVHDCDLELISDNTYKLDIDVKFERVKGFGENIIVVLNNVMVSEIESDHLIHEMNFDKKKTVLMTDTNYTHSFENNDTELFINYMIDMECKEIDHFKSLVLKFYLHYRDIYNKNNADIFYVLFIIDHTYKTIDYYKYFVENAPQQIKEI